MYLFFHQPSKVFVIFRPVKLSCPPLNKFTLRRKEIYTYIYIYITLLPRRSFAKTALDYPFSFCFLFSFSFFLPSALQVIENSIVHLLQRLCTSYFYTSQFRYDNIPLIVRRHELSRVARTFEEVRRKNREIPTINNFTYSGIDWTPRESEFDRNVAHRLKLNNERESIAPAMRVNLLKTLLEELMRMILDRMEVLYREYTVTVE